MGWFDTLLGVASVGAGIYNATQLETLRRQGGDAALIQAMTKYLRDRIFQIKQAAEWALAQEAQSVKIAAGAISVVESRLRNSGITPDLFPELSDKEYVMNTVRLIGENKRRLLELLSPDEQGEIGRVVAAADRLPDYSYYLENYNDGRKLLEAAPAVARYEERNGCLLKIGFPLIYFFVGLPTILVVFVTLFSGRGSSNAAGLASILLAIGIWVAGFVAFGRWQHATDYNKAKKVMDELKDKVDLQRFVALDTEFAEEDHARRLQGEAQSLITSFFGDSQLLNAS